MKTPEQMADEYAAIRNVADESEVLGANPWTKAAFLAGYKAAKPQWISVKERLPEEGDWVVTDSFDCCQRTKPPSNKFESIFVWRTTFNHYLKADAIKWWMPLPELPEAPKGEG